VDALLWGAAVIWSTATVVWTLGPTPPEADSFPLADKMLHALAYGVMVLLLSLAADRRPGRGSGPFPGSAVWLTVLAFAAGGALELLQHLTGRDTELLDWVADGVGAAIGLWGWTLVNRRWVVRPSSPRVGSGRR
jgi:VanZ family protein